MTRPDDSFMVDAALHALRGVNVPQIYAGLARHAALGTGIPETRILSRLTEQERSATSGIGGSVAIPHLRLKKLKRPYALLAKLARPVDFNAVDRAPVDLVLMLLSPEADIAGHLQRLSRFSRLMRKPALCADLRQMTSADGIAALMMGTDRQALSPVMNRAA